MVGGETDEGSEVKGEVSSPASTASVGSFYVYACLCMIGGEGEREREKRVSESICVYVWLCSANDCLSILYS